MPKPRRRGRPFDATMKELFEWKPEDWLRFLNRDTPDSVTVVDAEISTFSAAADKVFLVQDSTGTWIQHLEPQSTRFARLDRRTLAQNALLGYRHDMRVDSTVLLLRPAANSSRVTGRVLQEGREERTHLDFRYQLVRLWQVPVEQVLQGGLASLPLAPLADRKGQPVKQVVDRMNDRLGALATPEQTQHVWAAAYILMGLTFSVEEATEALAGVSTMRESVTYQAILKEGREEGRLEEALRMLLFLSERRLGVPSAHIRTQLEAISSVEVIEDLAARMLEVESWDELFPEPRRSP